MLNWLTDKGIVQSNPEEVMQSHKDTLKVCVREKIRKLSAPDEQSVLMHRRNR